MPSVARRRVIDTPVESVWAVVSDPYHLPRWWPRAIRVENVRGGSGERRSHWTTVLSTQSGRPVRADFRCLSSSAQERFVWEQELSDTPFERILRSSVLEIHLRPEGSRTEVELRSRQSLRGLSRLGSPMMRRATGRTLASALDALEDALA
ncbi:MAG TPA: SRPBCC family protein [Solirubrobacterales bacterium]|nr:SRPBCC family protein [Solirubrobacterales bacterium]